MRSADPETSLPRVLVEVCVDSLEKAERALSGGADRLEVCSRLDVGGYTPDASLLEAILEFRDLRHPDKRVFVMLRPWLDGKNDFVYSTDGERVAIFADLDMIASKPGVDGLVAGVLCPTSGDEMGIDHELMKGICLTAEMKHVKEVTFHRAFDEVKGNRCELIDSLAKYGTISRILTSGGRGQASRVDDGRNTENIRIYRACAERCRPPVTVVAGSGLNSNNAVSVIEATMVREIHGSFDDGKDVGRVVKNVREFLSRSQFKVTPAFSQ